MTCLFARCCRRVRIAQISLSFKGGSDPPLVPRDMWSSATSAPPAMLAIACFLHIGWRNTSLVQQANGGLSTYAGRSRIRVNVPQKRSFIESTPPKVRDLQGKADANSCSRGNVFIVQNKSDSFSKSFLPNKAAIRAKTNLFYYAGPRCSNPLSQNTPRPFRRTRKHLRSPHRYRNTKHCRPMEAP